MRRYDWSCKQPYIREEDLDKEISDLIKPYSLRGLGRMKC